MKKNRSMTKKDKGKIWITLGLLFLTAALCLTAYNLYDGMRAERTAREAADQLTAQLAEGAGLQSGDAGLGSGEDQLTPDYLLNPEMEMPVETVDGVDYIGILEIPALDLTLPVISRWNYDALRLAPCRYEGSAYLDNLVIAAHNYPSHFGSVKNLPEGTEILFTDMAGNRFVYEVSLVEVLPPTAIEEMIQSGFDLTLFTCTIGGQSRVAARCQRTSLP